MPPGKHCYIIIDITKCYIPFTEKGSARGDGRQKIRAFLTIIQLGSLRRAAQELNYTQSGLTQMMKHLEQEVGCRLLRRSHSGVTMTESAEHLLPYFQAADQALLQLRHESEQFPARSAKRS